MIAHEDHIRGWNVDLSRKEGPNAFGFSAIPFPPPPPSPFVVVWEISFIFPLRGLRMECDFDPLCIQVPELTEAALWPRFHLRHSLDTESVMLSKLKSGHSAPSPDLFAQSVPTTSSFPILVVFLLNYHSFFTLVVNRSTSEKQK